jgi:hypothetical protein
MHPPIAVGPVMVAAFICGRRRGPVAPGRERPSLLTSAGRAFLSTGESPRRCGHSARTNLFDLVENMRECFGVDVAA